MERVQLVGNWSAMGAAGICVAGAGVLWRSRGELVARARARRLQWWLRGFALCWTQMLATIGLTVAVVLGLQEPGGAMDVQGTVEQRAADLQPTVVVGAEKLKAKLLVMPDQCLRLQVDGLLLEVIHDGDKLLYRDRANKWRRLDTCLGLRVPGERWHPPATLAMP